ncbi:MAG: recombinase family protein [Oscillospiraceae bacterium]|nr:recombinase family protein [Oscillospiraceae bacterium]
MARTSHKQQKPLLSLSPFGQAKFYNVAIYARLSVEDNGKNSDSIESQIEYLEDFIANDPTMRKAAVFIDNGFTGTNFMRPEFQRMIDAARHGDINCVVVKDLSRLGRNYVETGEFLEKVCPFIGLRFIAVNDNYDSEAASNNSQLAASLSNIINDFYAKDISRKVYSALKTKMENGEYIGAWEKFGYLKDPANKNRLIVNPETAPIVQQIFLWRSEGISYMGINKRLNELEIPSPGQYKANRGIVTNNNQKNRKILWNRHIITDILRDITYIGHMAQRKTTQCLHKGIQFSRVNETDWIIAYNTHEPIISKELFYKVQEINRAASEKAKANIGKYDNLPKEKNIYGAKLVCADCGARIKLHRSFSTKKDKAYFTFNCLTYGEHGTAGCSSRAKRKADLDEAVFQSIRAQMNVFMDTANIIKSLLAEKQAANKGAARKKTKASLNNRIKSLCSAISTLYIDMKDCLLTDEEYLMQKEKYQAQIAELERALGEMNRDETDTEENLIGTKKWAVIVAEYSEATELSEGMLKACVEMIKVCADGSLEITFNYMQEFKELLATTERLRRDVA